LVGLKWRNEKDFGGGNIDDGVGRSGVWDFLVEVAGVESER